MKQADDFHVVTVGWEHKLVDSLVNLIEAKSPQQVSHIVHPKYTLETWPQRPPQAGVHFFRDRVEQDMPPPDRQLLASLEQDGVPSVHNMILGDRILSKLPYEDVLGYATFLSKRLLELFDVIRPTAIVIGFDAIHASLALAVGKQMGIPVFMLNFSVIPAGFACFCDRMSPAARVTMRDWPPGALLSLAEESLRRFESRESQAHAFIAPPPPGLPQRIMKLPARIRAAYRTIRRSRKRGFVKFTENRDRYSVLSALRNIRRKAAARDAFSAVQSVSEPPDTPFVLFGLHTQPESSIDVWAPFFCNQMWVIELLSRSIPPTHNLLVKVHKSDIANYSQTQLSQIRAIPGVQLIAPFADTRSFIERADLLVAIQGTMGLEAALLGKSVIMLGDSPVTTFPSATGVGALIDLPSLVRRKLRESPPTRDEIIDAYMKFLEPFFPASHNDWRQSVNEMQIDGYVQMFDALKSHLVSLGEMSSGKKKPRRSMDELREPWQAPSEGSTGVSKLATKPSLIALLLRSRYWYRKLKYGFLYFARPIKVDPSTHISRRAVIRTTGGGSITIGRNCEIHDYAMIMTYGGDIVIGDNCSLNPFSIVYGHGGVRIGNAVRIAAHTVIIPANHNVTADSRPLHLSGVSTKGIDIADNVWLGSGSRILDGVHIGKNSVVAAGGVVTKSVPENSTVAGVPARIINEN